MYSELSKTMPYKHSRLWLLFLFSSLVSLALGEGDCALTMVRQYEFRCGRKGNIRAPSRLAGPFSNTTEEEACAKYCLDSPECKSFRWVKRYARCYTYDKYLEQMYVDFDNKELGRLSNRECWSTDCDVIQSCEKTIGCSYLRAGHHYDYDLYQQYACAYGRTSQKRDDAHATILIDGSEVACDAAKMCAKARYRGSFDLHYHLPSKQWVCTRYDDADFTDGYYPAPDYINRKRYTLRNDSVGAGYGYWWIYTYYE